MMPIHCCPKKKILDSSDTIKKLPAMTFDKTKEYGLWGEYYGYGLVDAASAVKMVLNEKM